MSDAPALRQGSSRAQFAAFGNRLAKNARHWSRWARRRGLGGYRVYDRDVPQFPLAIDCYVAEDERIGRRVHLQEIDTGWQQDPNEHSSWLAEVTRVSAHALDVAAGDVVVKLRARRRGREQHAKTGRAPRPFVIVEDGLRFEVSLEAYVDTGLFLDHRALRARVRERAAGRRMLNLFAYTASFSVYAAAGGAASTESVDLSNTYLDWAARNFALNALDRDRHALVRADALAWLAQANAERRRYDLIVADVPAFSNSKAMADVFDVQRDHAALIGAARALLAPGGELYFSTNLRSFALDAPLRHDSRVEDIARAVRAEDFRDPRVHVAFVVRA